MSLVYVSAKIFAKPGMEDQLEKELKGVVADVRAETGCIRYDLQRGSENASQFLFYEIWENMETLKAHWEAPHMNGLKERTTDLLAQETEVNLWSGVDVAE